MKITDDFRFSYSTYDLVLSNVLTGTALVMPLMTIGNNLAMTLVMMLVMTGDYFVMTHHDDTSSPCDDIDNP